MVRDPVERIISWYYYVRAPWYFVERKRAFPELELPDPAWLKKVRRRTGRLPKDIPRPVADSGHAPRLLYQELYLGTTVINNLKFCPVDSAAASVGLQ